MWSLGRNAETVLIKLKDSSEIYKYIGYRIPSWTIFGELEEEQSFAGELGRKGWKGALYNTLVFVYLISKGLQVQKRNTRQIKRLEHIPKEREEYLGTSF